MAADTSIINYGTDGIDSENLWDFPGGCCWPPLSICDHCFIIINHIAAKPFAQGLWANIIASVQLGAEIINSFLEAGVKKHKLAYSDFQIVSLVFWWETVGAAVSFMSWEALP